MMMGYSETDEVGEKAKAGLKTLDRRKDDHIAYRRRRFFFHRSHLQGEQNSL